jgi:hypothetical protein
MATTTAEKSKTRAQLARIAGIGPISPVSILGGVLVAYATFAILLGATVAVLHHNGSKLDLTKGWDEITVRGGILLGVLLFVSYLLAGYMTGRMAWRRGVAHGFGVFVGSIVIVGVVALVVRSLAKNSDIKAVTSALRSFGIPTTRDEWRHVGSVVGIASLAGMLVGSIVGGLAGERWYTKVSRRLEGTEVVDVRDGRATTVETRSTNGHDRRAATSERASDSDIDDLSKEELYQRAQQKDIPGRSQMTKEELKKARQKQG